MALPKDFLHHLHEIAIEVSDNLRDEATARKEKLVFEAIRTQNKAAVSLAYKEAALQAFRERAEKTIERYIEAIEIWGIELDDSSEREMIAQVDKILAIPKHIQMPPGANHAPNHIAVQEAYSREISRMANTIRRKAANRLREAKMKVRKAFIGNLREQYKKLRDQTEIKNPSPQEPQMACHTAYYLNVLIASPSDVGKEREIVTKVIHDWNASHFASTGIILIPVKWESHAYPAMGGRPQAIITKQIVESGDILIGIFGYRLGTPTGKVQSGTIEEIEEFR